MHHLTPSQDRATDVPASAAHLVAYRDERQAAVPLEVIYSSVEDGGPPGALAKATDIPASHPAPDLASLSDSDPDAGLCFIDEIEPTASPVLAPRRTPATTPAATPAKRSPAWKSPRQSKRLALDLVVAPAGGQPAAGKCTEPTEQQVQIPVAPAPANDQGKSWLEQAAAAMASHGVLTEAEPAGPVYLQGAVTAAQMVRQQGMDLPEPNQYALRPLPPAGVGLPGPGANVSALQLPNERVQQQAMPNDDPSQVTAVLGSSEPCPREQDLLLNAQNEQAADGVAGQKRASPDLAQARQSPGVKRVVDVLNRLASPTKATPMHAAAGSPHKATPAGVTVAGAPAVAPSGAPMTSPNRSLRSVAPNTVSRPTGTSSASTAPTALSNYLPDYLLGVMHK